jgi:hypothetical protein
MMTRRSMTRTAFADPVRQVCSIMYDIPVELFMDPKTKDSSHPNLPKGKTLRDVLKYVGTEGMRTFDREIWCNKTMRLVDNNPETTYVITDVRFYNEYQGILDRGGEIYYLYRPNAEIEMLKNAGEHESENAEFYQMVRAKHSVFNNTFHCDSSKWEDHLIDVFFGGHHHELAV